MVGWLILGAVLLLVFLLLMMPVGIHAVFRGGLRLSLRLGPFRITLYPRPAKEKKRRRSEGKPQKESKHINRTEDRAEAAEGNRQSGGRLRRNCGKIRPRRPEKYENVSAGTRLLTEGETGRTPRTDKNGMADRPCRFKVTVPFSGPAALSQLPAHGPAGRGKRCPSSRSGCRLSAG